MAVFLPSFSDQLLSKNFLGEPLNALEKRRIFKYVNDYFDKFSLFQMLSVPWAKISSKLFRFKYIYSLCSRMEIQFLVFFESGLKLFLLLFTNKLLVLDFDTIHRCGSGIIIKPHLT